MNTNETQEIEIPSTWDVTVQAAERRGYRAGVEAAQDIVMRYLFLHYKKSYVHGAEIAKQEIPQLLHGLLAEQEKK